MIVPQMKPRPWLRNAIVLGFCLLALSARPGGAQTIKVKDDVGTVFNLPAPPRRIISLAPNITEILYALGLGDRIVAVTRYCNYPEAAKAKPKVGGMIDPDIERIKALSPDLIVAFRGNTLTALARLRELGLPVFTLDISGGLAAVPELVAKIGAATGSKAEAEKVRAAMAAKEKAVTEALAPVRTVPRVFLSLHGSGLWTFGASSYFTDLLHRVKAESITAGINKLWFEYGRESLIRDDPDAIVILARTDEEFRAAVRWFGERGGLKGLRAVRENRFLHLDQDSASRYGPRLYHALSDLAKLVHPEAFRRPDPR
jgi:iron complex transport system substrate-binding protein